MLTLQAEVLLMGWAGAGPGCPRWWCRGRPGPALSPA